MRLVTPTEKLNTIWEAEIDEISAVSAVELSDSVQSGAAEYACANVSVTDVSAVPVTVIVPFRSLPETDEVPPVTEGVGPDVMRCPHSSILSKRYSTVFMSPQTSKALAVERVLEASWVVRVAVGVDVPTPRLPLVSILTFSAELIRKMIGFTVPVCKNSA